MLNIVVGNWINEARTMIRYPSTVISNNPGRRLFRACAYSVEKCPSRPLGYASIIPTDAGQQRLNTALWV